jgi:hypothetical protein
MKRRALIEKVWDGRFCALLSNSYGYLSQKPEERMKLDQIFPAVFEDLPKQAAKRPSQQRVKDTVAATKAIFGLSPF